MFKGVLKLTAVFAALLILASCSKNAGPDWYEVTGSGVTNPEYSRARGRLMAKRAARADAQRQLLEAAKGVAVDSETTVRDFMTQDDYIQSRVRGVIRDARETDVRYYDDGSCEVDMKIDMNRVRDIIR